MIPTIIGILAFGKLQVNSRLIFLLVVTGSVPQMVSEFMGTNTSLGNLFYNINIPIEYTVIFFFFKTSFFSKSKGKIFYFIAIAGFLMAIAFLVFDGIQKRFISEWVCFNNIIFTAWILLLLLEIYEDDSIYLGQKMPLFWYLLGLFFYTSCTVLIFCFWGYITTTRNEYFNVLFQVYDLFNIFMYIAFSIGLLLDLSATTTLKQKKQHDKP
ncbi:MAG TPA: hypothetical protein VK718_04645 [Ferruginibacter sp.]|nr:hypothetical protein [Ferruginibacter sp.]